jgi:DNA-binding NarL/FixJ family response regulator
MRVAVAEDDYIYRTGLVRVLTAGGVDVVYEAASSEQLLAFLDRNTVDAVILDIELSRSQPHEGLTTAETVGRQHPGVGILLLSAHAEYHYAHTFFAGGSAGRGYALKENFNHVTAVTQALARVAAGQSYTDPDILELLMPHFARTRLEHVLTPREQELLALVAEGMTNAAIASRLRISPKSVEATATNVFRKLEIPSGPDHNPRVLAALRWHQEHRTSAGPSSTPL